MKKSLIALAVLAAAGAACAQSSVQLYGVADVWFGSAKTSGTCPGSPPGRAQKNPPRRHGGFFGFQIQCWLRPASDQKACLTPTA